MNQLRGIHSSRRIIDAVRNSLCNPYRKTPISDTQLHSFSSARNGSDSETMSHELHSDRPSNPRRRSRFDSPRDDESFLAKFKLNVDNVNDERIENPRREEPQDSPTNPNPNPPEDADEIFRKMKENGLIPNAVAMLDGLCQDGLVQEAMKLFGLMREKGTIPEVVVYTAVIEGFCKADKPDDAIRVFRKMQSNGIVANAFSYRVLVQGLCNCKRSEDSVGLGLEMLESGHSPNVATFVGLVDAVCEANGAEEGRAVIGKLRERGFVLNEKAVREFLEKKGSFSPAVWEVILGRKSPSQQRLF